MWYNETVGIDGRCFMEKWITDVHNHSAYSCDGVSPLKDMFAVAKAKGVAFYGTVEHFDYDVLIVQKKQRACGCDEEAYFHEARHLQEDYAGVMNVCVGAEFGFTHIPEALEAYKCTYEKYRPDFIVSSVHSLNGVDYYFKKPFYKDGVLRPKEEVYREYLSLVYGSIFTPYPVDIIGHIGYITRYAPYEDRAMRYQDYAAEFDGILKAIVAKDLILEVNSSNDGGVGLALPDTDVLRRYYELGGRRVSYASDAHDTDRIVKYRARTVELLKEIGFTHITVPMKEGRVEVEL